MTKIINKMKNMKRKLKKSLALLFCLLFILPTTSVKADDGITYLKTQTPDAWSVMALAAAGQDPGSLDFLKSVSGNLATDYAKAILALTAAGQNPATFGNVDYLSELKKLYTNNQFGSENLINDDVWSILALRSANESSSSSLVVGAKNFILANQNADGGWSYGVGSASDSNDTAAAIMALLEAGMSASDQVLTDAFNYLHSVQNTDGGFGYQAGDGSDSGSDSWVISALNKSGQNISAWSVDGNDPLSQLRSLQDADGGFWWVTPGSSEWNNKSMTAYAVIAMSGKSFPVAHYTVPAPTEPSGYYLLIQGQTKTICDTTVDGATPLDLIKNAADVCHYSFTITDSSYGQYLSAINSDQASGLDGWLYFVDNISPEVGAADYQLKSGDEVLWYYGEWGWQPTRISLDNNQLDIGGTVSAKVEYYNNGWQILPLAKVAVNGVEHTADANGVVTLTLNDPGSYNFFVKTSGYVPSSAVVTVGDTAQQSVNVGVEIKQGLVLGDSIVFSVTPNDLPFGILAPGQSADQSLTISNGGSSDLVVSATLNGDAIFADSLKLDDSPFSDFTSELQANTDKTVKATLTIDQKYLGSGIKNGSLIFWATPK
ncbi:MAG: DUF4430 domain-containing protein [Patescibacteria group bacterium]|nr:DUF4430 domain-containing protein [Patescibacteria group bacterium]